MERQSDDVYCDTDADRGSKRRSWWQYLVRQNGDGTIDALGHHDARGVLYDMAERS